MFKSAKGVLFFTVVIDLLGYGIIIPLLPDYTRTIGGSAALVGLLVAAYSTMQFFFSPILGSLSDRIGRRPILLATIALNLAAYLIFGFTESLILLFAARIIAGIGGANLAVAQAYLSDITPTEERTKAFGMIGAALGLGFVVGPPLGGLIADNFGIAAVGFAIAGLCALNFLSAFFLLPETRKVTDVSAPEVSAMSIIKNSASLQRLFAVYFVFIAGFGILTVVGALLWVDRFGLDEAGVGYTFGLIGLVTALVQGFVGKITGKVSQAGVMTLGLVVMATAMALMPLVPSGSFLMLGLGTIALFALGYGLVLPVGTALVAAETAPQAQGKILGLYQALGALARIAGPLIGGAAYQFDLAAPFFIGGALLMLAFLIAMSIRPVGRPVAA